jgi:hypothetical protein
MTPSKGRKSQAGRPNTAVVGSVLAFGNPWSNAGPQRYHDGNNAFTIPYRARYWYSITTGEDSAVSGSYRGGVMILPRVDTPFYKPTYTATNQLPITGWTSTGGSFAEYSDLASSFKSYRITSWGIRVYSIGPPLSSAGVVVVRTIQADDPTADTSGPTALAQSKHEEPIQPGMDFYWQSKPTDVSVREFQFIDSTSATELDKWTIPQIHIESASSTTVVRVEVTTNFEFVAAPNSFLSRMVKPAPERSEKFMDGVSRLFRALPNIMPNPDHGVGPALVRGANAVVSQIITQGVNRMLGPAPPSGQLMLEY